MNGHPQATVVLFPCSHATQGFKEATMGIISLFICLLVVCFPCTMKRRKRGECCIYRSQLEMSLVWPKRRCLVWPVQRCPVWPETVKSHMAGDGDVCYGRRRWCRVWLETVMTCMAGDNCWLWHRLMAFSHTYTLIYNGLVALLARTQLSF